MIVPWLALSAYADCTVQHALDAGAGSLRDCLDTQGAGDVITFDAAAFPTGVVTTITVSMALPALNGESIDAEANVRITPSGTFSGNHGLVLGTDSSLYGAIVEGFPGACVVVSGDGVVVAGNALHGCGLAGVRVAAGSDDPLIILNVVGSDFSGTLDGNCTAANTAACAGIVVLGGDNAYVASNEILNTQGDPQYLQGAGIGVFAGSNAVVKLNKVGVAAGIVGGGNTAAGVTVAGFPGQTVTGALIEANHIGANGTGGVFLGARTDGTRVEENTIGFELDLSAAGNGGPGVQVTGSDEHEITDNTVGFNTGDGIRLTGATAGDWHSHGVITGNLIGLTSSGGAAGNGGWGIYSSGLEGGSPSSRITSPTTALVGSYSETPSMSLRTIGSARPSPESRSATTATAYTCSGQTPKSPRTAPPIGPRSRTA